MDLIALEGEREDRAALTRCYGEDDIVGVEAHVVAVGRGVGLVPWRTPAPERALGVARVGAERKHRRLAVRRILYPAGGHRVLREVTVRRVEAEHGVWTLHRAERRHEHVADRSNTRVHVVHRLTRLACKRATRDERDARHHLKKALCWHWELLCRMLSLLYYKS